MLKRITLHWTLLLGLLMVQTAQVQAQMAKPVTVKSELKKVSDSQAQMVFTATVEAGWHIYSTQVVPDGPTPTTFTAEKLEGCELDGPLQPVGKPIKQYEDMFEADVYYFEGQGVFVQKLKLKGGPYRVEGYLRYGACNDMNCIPPTTVEVSFSGESPVAAAKAEEKQPVETVKSDE